jgi:hypothetical protein
MVGSSGLQEPAVLQSEPARDVDLAEEAFVVADHHEGSFVGLECALQLADADQVEVVGGLVEEE